MLSTWWENLTITHSWFLRYSGLMFLIKKKKQTDNCTIEHTASNRATEASEITHNAKHI